MFDTVMNLVKEWNVTGICLRLALATFVGVIIGLDREYKNKGAGIKTHALVCIGAAMAMIVNEYVFREFPNMNTDITSSVHPNRTHSKKTDSTDYLSTKTSDI
ncbi:MgtC/SapB family protein, partial [Dialister invisus]|uniref:MgtC/SapB family protein n=1 Tax=Dialister invisus TaxID=218538 RepID=UPI00307C63B3